MKKELKQYITYSFDAPKPLHKDEFIRTLNYPKTRWYDFITSQISFIRKRIWFISIILFVTAYLLVIQLPLEQLELLWIVSAFLPFLAMMTVSETIRSSVFGLAELEMTTRYSLRSVLLARIGILGAGNLVLLLLVIPLLAGKIELGFVKTGVYLLVPYLLASFLSYSLVNRIRSNDLTYYCVGIAAIISCCGLIFGRIWYVIYEQQYFIFWIATLTVLIAIIPREIYKLIKNSEELIWNSYSTV